jgi:hypothetical protein
MEIRLPKTRTFKASTILCCILVFFLQANAQTRTWVGKGSGGSSAIFNLKTNWSPAPAADLSTASTTDDLVMNLTNASTAISISFTANVTCNSVVINNTGADANNITLRFIIGTYALTTIGNFDVTNAAHPTPSSTTNRDYTISIENTGNFIIGGNLTATNPNVTASKNSIFFKNSGNFTVNGNCVINSAVPSEEIYTGGAMSRSSLIQFTTGNGNTTTFNGKCKFGDAPDSWYVPTPHPTTGKPLPYKSNILYFGANSSSDVASYIFKGDSLVFGGICTSFNLTNSLFRFEGTTQHIINNIFSWVIVPGSVIIGDGASINPTVHFWGSNKGPSATSGHNGNGIVPSSNLTIKGSSVMHLHDLTGFYTYNYATAQPNIGTMSIPANGTLILSGATKGKPGSNFPNGFATYTLSDASTVIFDGLLNQSIPSVADLVFNYGYLTLSGTGVKKAPALLTINSDMYRTAGSHTFDANKGRVIFNSSTKAQKYWADAGSMPINFYDFTNNNLHASGLSIDSTVGILDELKLNTNTKITLNTGDVILRSSDTLTAHVADLGLTIPSIVYNPSGRFVVERYLPAVKAWRFLATPLQKNTDDNTSATVTNSWREGSAGVAGALTNSGYGTRITGPTATYIGMDENTQRGSLKSYNPISDKWIEVKNSADTIVNDNGYMVFVRGGRNVGVGNPTSSTTLRIKGKIRTGTQLFNVPAGKFQSFGNPYASQLDLTKATSTNLAAAYTLWNPNSAGLYGVGAYENYILSGGSYKLNGTGAVRNFIESGQAIFIQSNSASAGTLTINEADKTLGSSLVSRGGAGNNSTDATTPTLAINMYAKNVDGSSFLADGLMLNFDDVFSNNVDNNDVRKIMNTFDNLAIKNGNYNLVVERRKNIVVTDTIKLNLTNTRIAPYRFEIEPSVLSNINFEAFLKDNFLQTETSVSLVDVTNYTFDITTDPASKLADRFIIIFKQGATTNFTTISAIRNTDNTVTVNWGTENERNISNYSLEQSNDGVNFTPIATTAPFANNGTNPTYSHIDAVASKANNWYRVKANNISGTTKYTAIAMVGAVGAETIGSPKMAIYPNHITDGVIKLYLNNQPQGTYLIQVSNSVGQTILTNKVILTSNNTLQIINMKNVASGNYQATIINEGGNKTTLPFIIK